MNITEVKVFPREIMEGDAQKLKAYASITIDEAFVVRGLKVIDGKNGLFVVMPSRKLSDGTFKDIAHPLNNETRHTIEIRVLEEYGKLKLSNDTRAQ